MKEKLRDKKVVYTIIGIISLLLIVIGITYAYWLVTKTQTNSNVISSACLDISISDEANDISLTNQFPLSDEDGMALTPYTFTVTNNCNTSVDYQVALEAIGDESTAIASSALKVALDEEAAILSDKAEVETTVSGAYESRAIGYSRLAPSGSEGASDTHSLQIWIDEDAPISEMNKTYTGKISVTIGQGILNPYQEGTLAYDILSNYGGAGAASVIDETTYAHRITASGNQYVSTSSKYYYGTDYTYDETTGKYTLSGTLVQAKTPECRNGTKTCGKYTLKSTSSTASGVTLYEVTDFQTSGNYITTNIIKYTNMFGVAESTPSLNKTTDDLGDSYYFRGAATDNYVQFGSYAEDTTITITDFFTGEAATVEIKAGTPMYWRIVRINGDGSIRMIYDGTAAVANGTAHTATIGNTTYNNNYIDPKYVGYTYDTSATDSTQVNSTIKGVIDAWYDTHLEANYGSYIADSIFCNDREETSYYYYDENYSQTTADQAVYTDIYYGAYSRLSQNKAPKLTCTRKEDRYTTSEATGNGYLSNPVGLLTADEVFFAGGTINDSNNNNNYYLYSGACFWTSTPRSFFADGGVAIVWGTYGNGHISEDVLLNFGYDARPVTNLKADVQFEGSGTINDPYVITAE